MLTPIEIDSYVLYDLVWHQGFNQTAIRTFVRVRNQLKNHMGFQICSRIGWTMKAQAKEELDADNN